MQCAASMRAPARILPLQASWKVYNADSGLPATATTALAEDDWGRIWVGTEGGLARIDTEGQVEFATRHQRRPRQQPRQLPALRPRKRRAVGWHTRRDEPPATRRLGNSRWAAGVRVSQPLPHRRTRCRPDLCRPAAGGRCAHFHRGRRTRPPARWRGRPRCSHLERPERGRLSRGVGYLLLCPRRQKLAMQCAANSP